MDFLKAELARKKALVSNNLSFYSSFEESYKTPPARGDTFLLVVGDVILWVSNLATSAKSWGQTFNNS